MLPRDNAAVALPLYCWYERESHFGCNYIYIITFASSHVAVQFVAVRTHTFKARHSVPAGGGWNTSVLCCIPTFISVCNWKCANVNVSVWPCAMSSRNSSRNKSKETQPWIRPNNDISTRYTQSLIEPQTEKRAWQCSFVWNNDFLSSYVLQCSSSLLSAQSSLPLQTISKSIHFLLSQVKEAAGHIAMSGSANQNNVLVFNTLSWKRQKIPANLYPRLTYCKLHQLHHCHPRNPRCWCKSKTTIMNSTGKKNEICNVWFVGKTIWRILSHQAKVNAIFPLFALKLLISTSSVICKETAMQWQQSYAEDNRDGSVRARWIWANSINFQSK